MVVQRVSSSDFSDTPIVASPKRHLRSRNLDDDLPFTEGAG